MEIIEMSKIFYRIIIIIMIVGFSFSASFYVGAAQIKGEQTLQDRKTKISDLESALSALQNKDSEIRRKAVFYLSKNQDPRAVNGLIIAVKDKSSEVRYHAIRGLAKKNDPKVVDGLLSALKDSDSHARWIAVDGLVKQYEPRIVEPLKQLLNDKDVEVREKVVSVLRITGNSRAAGLDEPKIGITKVIDSNLPPFERYEDLSLGSGGNLSIKNRFNVWIRVGARFLDFKKEKGKESPVFNKRGANFWIKPNGQQKLSVGILGPIFYFVFIDKPNNVYSGKPISLMLGSSATLELNSKSMNNYKLEKIR